MKLIKSLLIMLALFVMASPGQSVLDQSASLLYDEARTVYLGNLARRDNGVPPLRWNRNLTDAARWFSWDSVENRPTGYCGHQDTLGGWPSDRAPAFGYKGGAGAENAFCGYVTPEYAIQGWMGSQGHRANLLDPNSREVGLGYYRRTTDGRGYVTQDFGSDPVFAPLVIENEALNTTSSQVGLYIYDRQPGGGFSEFSPATEMLIANDACFSGASWAPYQAQRTWNLAPGEGWRSVYVKTRDILGRTMTVSDTIYLGANLPLPELGYAQMSATQDRITLVGLNGRGLPLVQFSLDWRVDNTFGTFGLNWGNGETVNDAAAWGGSAFRMFDGAGETMAWVWTTEFIRNTPFVAYVRLKVSNNQYSGEVARIAVDGDTVTHEISLKGTDFTAANQYQEFPIPFTFVSGNTFLIFKFWRSGVADVYFDGFTIFTSPQAMVSPYIWLVPGGNYRGQGIWVRYSDGAGHISAIEEAGIWQNGLGVSRQNLTFLAKRGGPSPSPNYITVKQLGCQPVTWQSSADQPWLVTHDLGDQVQVSINPTGLSSKTYTGTVTITPTSGQEISPIQVQISLVVVEVIFQLYLGLIN